VTTWFPENGEHVQTPAVYPQEFEQRRGALGRTAMTTSDAPPEGAGGVQSKGKSRLDRPSVFGTLSVVIGLAVGAFGALLLWKASVHLATLFETLFCYSPVLVGLVVLAGVLLAKSGAKEAEARDSRIGQELSGVGIPLIVLGSVVYLLGWLSFVFQAVFRGFSY